MYPFDMPGITRKENTKFSFFKSSYVKFALNKDALIEDAVKQLIYDIPPQTKVMFFDISYPSPSDPGAYVSYMRVDNQYIMQRANHGWTNKWEFINAEELKNYLSKCSAIHILGANPFEDMFVYYKIEPPLPEKFMSEEELIETKPSKGQNKLSSEKILKILLTLLFVFLLLAFLVAILFEGIK